MTHSNSLALITAVYQNYTVLPDFFESLTHQTDTNFHIFISDVSKDKQKIPSTPVPYTVLHGENKGYAHSINLGLEEAIKKGFTHYCVLNNDITFDKSFIKHAHTSLLDHPGTILGGKIYYAPGFEYHKGRYQEQDRGKVIWYAGGSIDWKHVLITHRGVDEVDCGQYEKVGPTEFITGCLMCYDKRVYDALGPWDDSYFMYYEDADYCVRAKRKNIPMLYDPSLIIWHKNAQSSEGSGSAFHEKYQTKNRLTFGLKYAPLRTKLHLLKNKLLKKTA